MKQKGKKGGAQRSDKQELEAIAAAKSFIDENLLADSFDKDFYELAYLNGNVYIKPKIALPKYSVFAAGVCVGELVGKRLVPHHQLFSAYGSDMKLRVDLSREDSRVAKYLRGEEIDTELQKSGWCAVCYEGVPIGGGKISSGKVKNQYPKGLRNNK